MGVAKGGVVGVVIIHMYVCITQRQTMRFAGDLTLMYTTHAPEPVRIDVRMYIHFVAVQDQCQDQYSPTNACEPCKCAVCGSVGTVASS